jgi:hypothetical protein
MATVADLIDNALAEIGFIAAEQTLSTANLTFCFDRLNRMIDSWKTQKRFVYAITPEEFAFGSSKQYYTIGPSGDFVISAGRPIKLENYCNVILVGTTNVRVPIPVINSEEWAEIPIAALSTEFPNRIYYKPTYPDGTLYPWPYPTNVSNKLELFIWQQIDKFLSTSDTLNLPPGYEDAITLSLAEVLCSGMGKTLEPDLAEHAKRARANIANVNVKAPRQITDYPQSDGGGMQWDPRIRGWR